VPARLRSDDSVRSRSRASTTGAFPPFTSIPRRERAASVSRISPRPGRIREDSCGIQRTRFRCRSADVSTRCARSAAPSTHLAKLPETGSNPAPANPFNKSSIAATVTAQRSCGHDLNPHELRFRRSGFPGRVSRHRSIPATCRDANHERARKTRLSRVSKNCALWAQLSSACRAAVSGSLTKYRSGGHPHVVAIVGSSGRYFSSDP
jgi:hypothetical protein